jgi:hypothetical protein
VQYTFFSFLPFYFSRGEGLAWPDLALSLFSLLDTLVGLDALFSSFSFSLQGLYVPRVIAAVFLFAWIPVWPPRAGYRGLAAIAASSWLSGIRFVPLLLVGTYGSQIAVYVSSVSLPLKDLSVVSSSVGEAISPAMVSFSSCPCLPSGIECSF